uniref:Uncharacterized protein n=1 Tax=Cucumis melo TaxID=3656 RepID=A0A9I9DM07_CUCME
MQPTPKPPSSSPIRSRLPPSTRTAPATNCAQPRPRLFPFSSSLWLFVHPSSVSGSSSLPPSLLRCLDVHRSPSSTDVRSGATAKPHVRKVAQAKPHRAYARSARAKPHRGSAGAEPRRASVGVESRRASFLAKSSHFASSSS